MSSKIKVDTIENVAGSGNVSLGSGHNLVVPGNITGQGTAAITSNATVGGTLGITGESTLTGGVKVNTIKHTGGTTGIAISTAGFVTRPETPMCSVTKNVNAQVQTISGSSTYTLTGMTSAYLNSHSVNNKSYWDTSNSRFAIPSGTPTAFYYCEFNTLFGITRPSSGVNWGYIELRKQSSGGYTNNNSAQAYREATNGMGTGTYVYDMISCACIYQLAAGDWVEPRFGGSAGVAMQIHPGNYTSFTAFQVG